MKGSINMPTRTNTNGNRRALDEEKKKTCILDEVNPDKFGENLQNI